MGGEYVANVAPAIDKPPVVAGVVFEYHWYKTFPAPPVSAIDKAVGVPPAQIV